jgi:hypothetical protein
MKPALCAALACVLLAGPTALAADDVPSFKKRGDAEKKFVTQVGTAIVKAARSTSQKVDLEEYKYSSPKPGRTHLTMKMVFYGVITKKKYTADITVIIDSHDKDNWEVLNIKYTDNSANPIGPSEKKIQELIKKLNR